MRQFDIDDLSKNMFMAALHAAKGRAGSIRKLSMTLGLEPRRCQIWFSAGVMPLYPLMQELYPKLLDLADTTHDRLVEK